MTDGRVGVWEKMTDDNDWLGGRQQENYVNWKIEPGLKFFKVLECGGGKEL